MPPYYVLISLVSRQLQYRLDVAEADSRQESEKARSAQAQLDRLREERSHLQSESSVRESEVTLLRANEKRALRDLADHRERMKTLEEELHKVCHKCSKNLLKNIMCTKTSFLLVLLGEGCPQR